MKLKKGSPEAKAHMARLRSLAARRRRDPVQAVKDHYGFRSNGRRKNPSTSWVTDSRSWASQVVAELLELGHEARFYEEGFETSAPDAVVKKVASKLGGIPVRKGTIDNPGGARSAKALDRAIEQAYYRVASGVQVSILDIPKIFKDARELVASGRADIDAVLIEVVKRYQQPTGRMLNNPPAFFIIDPVSNKILSIVRGHPAKTYPKSVEVAAAAARRVGHNVVHVVHPYVPAGRKVGDLVTPLFYGYGSNEVDAQGNVYKRNPKFKARFTAADGVEMREATVKAHGFKSAMKKAQRLADKMPPQFTAPRSEVEITRCNPSTCKNPGHRHARKNPMLQMVTLANPSSGAALKAKMVAFLKKWGKGIVDESESTNFDREGAIYWFANDYHGGGGSALYQVLSMSKFRPGPSVGGPETDIEKMMYEALEQEFGRKLKNPLSRGEVAEVVLHAKDIHRTAAREKKGGNVGQALRQTSYARGMLDTAERYSKGSSARRVVEKARGRFESIEARQSSRTNPVPRGTRPSWMKTYCVMCGEWLKSKGPYHRMKVGPKKGQVICDNCYRGIRSGRRMGQSWAKNPPIPFKQGQIITVEQALAWARKTGNASLIKQCQEAIKLCKKANGPAQKVRFDLVQMGDPKKIESVMAGVEYGQTDETVYKPTKGSKKGQHLYRHEWGEGSGRRKPVPLIAPVGGKTLVMPLGSRQKATDWLRG